MAGVDGLRAASVPLNGPTTSIPERPWPQGIRRADPACVPSSASTCVSASPRIPEFPGRAPGSNPRLAAPMSTALAAGPGRVSRTRTSPPPKGQDLAGAGTAGLADRRVAPIWGQSIDTEGTAGRPARRTSMTCTATGMRSSGRVGVPSVGGVGFRLSPPPHLPRCREGAVRTLRRAMRFALMTGRRGRPPRGRSANWPTSLRKVRPLGDENHLRREPEHINFTNNICYTPAAAFCAFPRSARPNADA